MKIKFFSLWLALACIIIFILQVLIPSLTQDLLLNQSALSQPYRFITAVFLHADLTHLVFNLFALILFGLILESLISSRRLLVIFFASGILANIVSVFFYPASLGASGAIFGVIGCLTVIKPRMTVWAYSLPMPLFLAAIIWTLASVFGIFNPSGVGDIAHLSGLLVGLIFGLYLRLKHFKKQETKANYSRIILSEQDMQNWEDAYLK